MNNQTAQKLSSWWSQSLDELVKILNLDVPKGLSMEQAEEHKVTYGANILTEIKPTSIGELILDGVKEPMMIVLLSIGGISLLFGKPVEAINPSKER